MEQLNILDMKILHMLQNYPLEPYSAIAEKLKISTSTLIRRIKGDKGLIKRGILRYALTSFTPERIALQRFGVMFSISSLHQFTLLQNALSEHNYIRGYNRYYGESYGIYAYFDLPANQEAIFKRFCDHLVAEEYCDDYSIMKSLGYRFSSPQQMPIFTESPEHFDLISFWEKRLSKSQTLPRLPSSIDLNTIEPLHFLMLRDMTRSVKNGRTIDFRSKQTELIEHYFDYYKALNKKITLTEPEKDFYFNLSELFKNMPIPNDPNEKVKITENVKVEFGRKYYNLVMNNLITNPRWNISRSVFEQHVTRVYFIENVPEQEKAQFYRFITEETPPFQTGFELYNSGILLRLTLPPYYDSKINYLIWSTFKDYKIYSLDFFSTKKSGLIWPFYINNFDWKTKNWRTDEDWMFTSVVDGINDKLKNNKFGEIQLNKRSDISYLRKYMNNGNGNGNGKDTNKNGVTA